MDLSNLLDADFDAWEVPLNPEQIGLMSRFYERLGDYRDRLNRQVQTMHRVRLETRAAAGLPEPDAWNRAPLQPGASCEFAHLDADRILYRGESWFRHECESFDTDQCEPLPLKLLSACEEEILAHYQAEAAAAKKEIDDQAAVLEQAACAAREIAERAEFERLRLKFGR